ncbi:MAG TPA: GWxTD domain-containing protein, partial [Gemmatimonadales bacterium]|nr:GWxTD domain-containing protein [Gemmatimonadales bacterium]
LQHLRLGFLALRLGELGGKAHYEDAASEFEWAAELEPTWPYPWYGLGSAELGVGDSEVSLVAGLQTMFGKDHLTRAANAFARSAQVDPGFVKGLVELAATALKQRVNIKTDVALQALRVAAATPAGRHPDVLLYRGRIEREVGSLDSALVAFEGYLASEANRGLGLLEVARTRFLLGSTDGVGPYFEGAASDDAATVAAYRADLVPLVSDSVLRELDTQSGERRAAYLRRFWAQRDGMELRRPGERLREHYRRYFHARRHFGLVSLKRHYDIVERYRSGSRDFDDRGVIYIRHGEPTERATHSAPGLEPNESWLYKRADGDLVFHFVAREDVQDFKLVESVFDVLGFSRTVALRAGDGQLANDPVVEQLVRSREHFSPVYTRLLASGGGAGSDKYFAAEREHGRGSIERGTSSDSYELAFRRELRARADVIAVGRDSAGSLVQVAYAIPGSALTPVPTAQGHLYPLRIRLALLDRFGNLVGDLDTTRLMLAAEPVPPAEHLVGRVALPVPAGTLTYRLAVQHGDDAGVVFPTGQVSVGRTDGADFAVSDVVVGHPSANVAWRPTPSDTVYFEPRGAFDRRGTLELYYEVYGVPAGAEYESRVAVLRQGGGGGFLGLFGGRKTRISLSSRDRSEGTVNRVHRSLQLEPLKPGAYTIELTVTDDQGRKIQRQRDFVVTEARPR